LREDSLEALAQRPYVTLSEAHAEAFTYALIMGGSFPFAVTEVEPERFTVTERPNRYPGSCIECGGFIVDGQGLLARRVDGTQRWAVIHAACASTATVPTMSITLNEGITSEYLHAYSTAIVPEERWPYVEPPLTYTAPALNPPNTLHAARLLRLLGVFDQEDAVEALSRRPELRIVPQRANAVEIVERVMARIARDRGEPVPTPAAVEARVQEFERSAATRILRSPYVDQAALVQRQRAFSHLVGSGRPGPFIGSDRGARGDGSPGLDPVFWDWSDILARQAMAHAKVSGMPKCRVCDRPLTLDQPDVHYSCGSATSRT
jgi:hypothetical protein